MKLKRILTGILSAALVLTGIPAGGGAITAKAADTPITGVSVTYYELEAGEAAKDPLVVPGQNGTRYATIADRAASPATLTPNSVTYAYQTDATGYASWGFKGELTDAAGGTGSVFDVHGSTPMILRFKARVQNKSDVPTGTVGTGPYAPEKTMQLLGKMDNQYGVQMRQDKVIVYAEAYDSANTAQWVQSECPIDDTFWGKWHDIMVVFTGTRMQIYVDGVAGHATAGRPNETDPTVTLKHNADSVFTTGYNKTKRDQNTEDAYVPFNGYLEDIELYKGTDYTAGLTKAYGAVSKALDSATPAANITLKPFSSKTDWYKVTDNGETAVASGTILEQHTVYKAVTTLTAHTGYVFPQTEGAELSNNGRTLTYTKTYGETGTVPCLCTLGNITLADQTVDLGDTGEAKEITLRPRATVNRNGCTVHSSTEGRVTYTYEITESHAPDQTESSDAIATVTPEGVVTALTPGTAKIKVTASMTKNEGDPVETKEKIINLTVKGNKEAAEAKREAEALKAAQDEFLKIHGALTQDDSGKYTAESWNKVVAADETATGLYNDSTKEESNVKSVDLQAAVDALKAAVDALETKEAAAAKQEAEALKKAKADQEAALKAAQAIVDAGQKDYPKAAWDAFVAAYNALKAAPANADSAKLNALTAALTGAQKALTVEAKLAAPTITKITSSADRKGITVKVAVGKVDGADHYEVYCVSGGKETLVGSSKSGKTVVKDKKNTKKSVQYYAVAVSKDGKTKSDKGALKKVTLNKAPKIKSAKSAGGGIRITWSKVKNAKNYAIYRSTKKNSGYKRIVKPSKKSTSYVDKKAAKGKTYYYKIAVRGKSQTSLMSKAKKAKR